MTGVLNQISGVLIEEFHCIYILSSPLSRRLDAEVEETTLFREPREGTTKGSRGSLNCVVSETTHLDYCACTHTNKLAI